MKFKTILLAAAISIAFSPATAETNFKGTSATAVTVTQSTGTNIITIDTTDAFSGAAGQATTGAGRIKDGTYTAGCANGIDSGFKLCRDITNGAVADFMDSFQDASHCLNNSVPGMACTSFDAFMNYQGSQPFAHGYGFQWRPQVNLNAGVSPGTMGGLELSPTFTTGEMGETEGVRIHFPTIGAGMTFGTTSIYAGIRIFAHTGCGLVVGCFALINDSTDAIFTSGPIQLNGGAITGAGSVTAQAVNAVYSNNAFLPGIAIRNTNTGSTALAGLQLQDELGNDIGDFSYFHSNYADAALAGNIGFSTLGTTAGLTFTTHTGAASGAASGNIGFQIAGNVPSIFIQGAATNNADVGILNTTPLYPLDVGGTLNALAYRIAGIAGLHLSCPSGIVVTDINHGLPTGGHC